MEERGGGGIDRPRGGVVGTGDRRQDSDFAVERGEPLDRRVGRPAHEDHRLDVRMGQQRDRAVAIGTGELIRGLPRHIDPRPGRHPGDDPPSAEKTGQSTSHLPGHRTMGNGDHRHATIVIPLEHQVDDRLPHRPRFPLLRGDVHEHPRSGVDLDHHPALLPQGATDLLGDQIDAGDVEPDGPGGEDGVTGDVGMDLVGLVGGQVAVDLDRHAASHGGDAPRLKRLPPQQPDRQIVELHDREDVGVVRAAERVAVGVVDERADRAHAIANDDVVLTTGRRHAPLPHDEEAMGNAMGELLDNHAAGAAVIFADGDLERLVHVVVVTDPKRNAAPVIAVARLDDDGEAELGGGQAGLLDARRHPAARHRHPDLLEEHAGHLLVLRQRLGDGAGGVGLGGPDPSLPHPLAELAEAVVGDPAAGDAPGLGSADDRARARPQPRVVGEFGERRQLLPDVDRAVVDRRQQQFPRQLERRGRHLLVVELDRQAESPPAPHPAGETGHDPGRRQERGLEPEKDRPRAGGRGELVEGRAGPPRR